MRRKIRTEEEKKEYQKEYIAWYQQENIEKHRLAAASHLRELRSRIFELLGDKCANCGFSDRRALQIDHKDGGGSKEIKSSESPTQYLRMIIKNLSRYQILCANCNWIKRYTHQEMLAPRGRVKIVRERPKRIYKER